MLNWLASVVNLITGAIDDIKKWIVRIIQTIYSYFNGLIDALGRELVNVWNELYAFITQVEHWAIVTFSTLSNAITTGFHDIISWASAAITDVKNWALDAYHYILNLIDDIYHRLLALWDAIVKWVMQNIWNPLYNLVSGAIHWIENEGAYIWNLITHPDLIVKLLGHYLWISWLDLIKFYGKPIGRWLMHSMLGLAGELADVVETFIASWL